MISSVMTVEPVTNHSRLHQSFYTQLLSHQIPSDLADTVAWKLAYEGIDKFRSPEDQAMIDAAAALIRKTPEYQALFANRGSGRVSV